MGKISYWYATGHEGAHGDCREQAVDWGAETMQHVSGQDVKSSKARAYRARLHLSCSLHVLASSVSLLLAGLAR